jgi:hypothetical protein
MSRQSLPNYGLQELATTMIAVLDGSKDQVVDLLKIQRLLGMR